MPVGSKYQLNTITASTKSVVVIDLSVVENFNQIIREQTDVVVLHGRTTFDQATMKVYYTPSPFYDSVEVVIQIYYLDMDMRSYVVPVVFTDKLVLPPTINPDLLLGAALENGVESGGLKYSGSGLISFDPVDTSTLSENYGGLAKFFYGGKKIGEMEFTKTNIGKEVKVVYDDDIFSVTLEENKKEYLIDGVSIPDTGGGDTGGGDTGGGDTGGGDTGGGDTGGGDTGGGDTGGDPPPEPDNSEAGIKPVESKSKSEGGSAACGSGTEKSTIDFKMKSVGDGFVKISGTAKEGCLKIDDVVEIKVNNKIYKTKLKTGSTTPFMWDADVLSSDIFVTPKVESKIFSKDLCLKQVITTAEIEFPPENIKLGYPDKDKYIDKSIADMLASGAILPPAPPLKAPAGSADSAMCQLLLCKMIGESLSAEEIDGMIEALQQLNNTLYEIHTGIPNAIYPELGVGKKPAPIADREANKAKKNIHNSIDILSTIITGKKFDDLELGKEGGESGEYDTTLNGRLKKTTEMLTGILTCIFTEDEIKAKLEGLDLNKKSSIEAALGPMTEKGSFLKNSTHAQERITRAIEALVISYVHSDLKGDVRMSTLSKTPYPENIHEPFWTELKEAYTKVAGDFTHNLRNLDRYEPNNHKYPIYPNSGDNITD